MKQSVFPEFEEKFFEEDNQYGAGSFMYRAYGKVTFRCYNLNMIIAKNLRSTCNLSGGSRLCVVCQLPVGRQLADGW